MVIRSVFLLVVLAGIIVETERASAKNVISSTEMCQYFKSAEDSGLFSRENVYVFQLGGRFFPVPKQYTLIPSDEEKNGDAHVYRPFPTEVFAECGYSIDEMAAGAVKVGRTSEGIDIREEIFGSFDQMKKVGSEKCGRAELETFSISEGLGSGFYYGLMTIDNYYQFVMLKGQMDVHAMFKVFCALNIVY